MRPRLIRSSYSSMPSPSSAPSANGRPNDTVISLRRAGKTYSLGRPDAVAAVHDLDLDVERGEFVVITGRSGSGKTTLLNLAAGLTRPTAGQVLLEGRDLWSLSDREQSFLRNQKIGFVFQFPSLVPALTAMENVLLPTLFGLKGRKQDATADALRLLTAVGLEDKANARPRQLSKGQQQRVVVARALVSNPEILIADEPTSNLDERTEVEIMDLIKEIHDSTRITVMLVTHASQLAKYGTRSLKMVEGRLAV